MRFTAILQRIYVNIEPPVIQPTPPPESTPDAAQTQPYQTPPADTAANPEAKPPEEPTTVPEPLLRTPEPASTLLPPLTPEDTPESLEPFAKVHALTDIELRFAATLYLQKNQKAISAKGVSKRQETMESNLAKILGYLKSNSPAPLPRIAKHINTSPGTTSHYLQILIKSHLVKATGWSAARRYSHR